jgi:hypothetical protein
VCGCVCVCVCVCVRADTCGHACSALRHWGGSPLLHRWSVWAMFAAFVLLRVALGTALLLWLGWATDASWILLGCLAVIQVCVCVCVCVVRVRVPALMGVGPAVLREPSNSYVQRHNHVFCPRECSNHNCATHCLTLCLQAMTLNWTIDMVALLRR